ncbi:hypothetical protein F4806DRAFT_497082 [Annulohypoxylon nitens]|nr:hypothetical protein F4806DRAFT_497082 [Annulohypoxylon nitens]
MPPIIKRGPAQLHIIDYEKIRQRNPAEIENLLQASRPPTNGGCGVFYLDLRGPTTQKELIDVKAAYSGSMKYFQQSSNTKMNDFLEHENRGFKPGKVFETLEINHDEYTLRTYKLPAALEPSNVHIEGLLSTCHAVTRDIQSVLLAATANSTSSQQGNGHVDVTRTNPANTPSETGLKIGFQSSDPEPWEVTGGAHTDMSILSMLFYDAATMELPSSASPDTWELIEPVDGCCVVNIADSLQKSTGGEFHSPIHRVVQPDNVPKSGTPMIIYYLR